MFVPEEVHCGRGAEIEVSEGERRLSHCNLWETMA